MNDGAYIYVAAPRGLKASSCSKKGALSREERRRAATSTRGPLRHEHDRGCAPTRVFYRWLDPACMHATKSMYVCMQTLFGTATEGSQNFVLELLAALVAARAPASPIQRWALVAAQSTPKLLARRPWSVVRLVDGTYTPGDGQLSKPMVVVLAWRGMAGRC